MEQRRDGCGAKIAFDSHSSFTQLLSKVRSLIATPTHSPATAMAEEQNQSVEATEVSDRGLFGFGKKKEEKVDEEVLVAGVEKVHIDEGAEEEKKETLLDKLRSHSSSSSSSSDEEEADEEKKERRRKRKALLEEIKQKGHDDHKAEEETVVTTETAVSVPEGEDTAVVVEKVETDTTTVPEGEKKGFLEKVKEKLPGHKKTTEEAVEVSTPPPVAAPPVVETEVEKKSFIEKIKEKLPGYHKSGGEEGEKPAASH